VCRDVRQKGGTDEGRFGNLFDTDIASRRLDATFASGRVQECSDGNEDGR